MEIASFYDCLRVAQERFGRSFPHTEYATSVRLVAESETDTPVVCVVLEGIRGEIEIEPIPLTAIAAVFERIFLGAEFGE